MRPDLPPIPTDRPDPWRRCLRDVLRLSAPLIPAMVAQMAMGFFDTWMVSQIGVAERSIGPWSLPLDTIAEPGVAGAALAAVVPANFMFMAVTLLFRGTAYSVSTFASQSLGRGDESEAGRYAWQGIHLALMTILVAVAASAGARMLFAPFAPNEQVLALEAAYFRVAVLALPVIVMQAALRGFFQGVHRTGIPAAVGIGMNVANLALNWLLIYGRGGLPRMGIEGAAAGTAIANLGGMLVLGAFFLLPASDRRFGTRRGWRPSARRMRRLIFFGAPAGLSWLLDMVGWSLLIVVVVQRLGEAEAAASNAAMNYLQLGFMPVVGVAIAITALVGKAVGARRLANARRLATCGFLISGGYQLAVGVAMIVWRHELIGFFSSEPRVVELGGYALICAGVFQFFDAVGIIYAHALRAAGDTHFLFRAHLLLIGAIFIPGALAMTWWVMPRLAPGLESIGAWLAGTAYIILLGATFYIRWRGKRWQQIDLFGDRGERNDECRMNE